MASDITYTLVFQIYGSSSAQINTAFWKGYEWSLLGKGVDDHGYSPRATGYIGAWQTGWRCGKDDQARPIKNEHVFENITLKPGAVLDLLSQLKQLRDLFSIRHLSDEKSILHDLAVAEVLLRGDSGEIGFGLARNFEAWRKTVKAILKEDV